MPLRDSLAPFGTKRSLALREFTLGIEGGERFFRHKPLLRGHECNFGVVALERESVNQRLWDTLRLIRDGSLTLVEYRRVGFTPAVGSSG